MPPTADVEPLVIVALIGVAVLIAVIAVALIAVARVLQQVSRRLEAIVGQVGDMPPEVQPPEDVLESINADLKTAQELLEDDPPEPMDAERK